MRTSRKTKKYEQEKLEKKELEDLKERLMKLRATIKAEEEQVMIRAATSSQRYRKIQEATLNFIYAVLKQIQITNG